MPKKKQEQEQEIDLSTKKEQKKTYVTRWFDTNVVNNKPEIKITCDLTARSVAEQFSMSVRSGHTELFAVIFYVTFIQILKFISSKQKTYNNFTMEICSSINVGYCNNDDPENEKVGNFMPILEYIGINRNIITDDSTVESDATQKNYLRWKELNIKKTVEGYKDIQNDAYKVLQEEYKIYLPTEEAIIPIFCIFMDNLSNVLKQRYKELIDTDVSEVKMNVMGLFDMYYSYNDETGEEIIDIQPNITTKLKLKRDDVASRE